MHVAFGEEALRRAAPAVDDFREVADGLGVEPGVEGGECGGAAAEEELNVAEELGHALGVREKGSRRS